MMLRDTAAAADPTTPFGGWGLRSDGSAPQNAAFGLAPDGLRRGGGAFQLREVGA